MGDPITGRETIVGLKKAATWGTAVACGAGDGLLILSENVSPAIEEHLDDSAGLAFIQRTDKGKAEASGTIDAYMRYEGLDVALALIMGAAGAPSQQEATTAYTNSYVMADSIWGKFATYAAKKKSDKIHELPAIKLHGFKLSGEMNGPVRISLDCMANELELASTTNTIATMANVTYPDKGNRIIWDSNATWKINDESGDALDDDDKIYPSSFELSFTRPMDPDWVAGATGMAEPSPTGFPEALLTLNFPRYDDDNHGFFTDWDAFTRKKMEIYFKGALIESTYYYELKISMPNLKATDVKAPMTGPSKIPLSVSFRLLGTDTAPTGMTGITKPFQLDIQNTRTTDPLT